MTTSHLSRSRVLLILALLTVAAFAPALHNSFVWDDNSLITNNAYIRNATFIPAAFTTDLFHDYTVSTATHYRPLQTLTFMADYALWGLNAFGYHLTNLLLHLACVLLLALLIERWSASLLLALGVAGLFAVHPVNANAIAYIAGRADPLAFGWMLAALLLLSRSAFTGAALCAVAALFSRENAMLLPVLILLIYRRRALPFALLVIAFYFWRREVLLFQAKHLPVDDALPVLQRIPVALRSLATYFGLLVWPAQLQMERLVEPARWLTVTGAGLAIGLTGLLVWTRRRLPLAFLGLAWFVVTLAPLTGLFSLNATVAEHWLYVPAVGFFLAVGVLLAKYWPHRPSLIAATALVLIALTGRTIYRCRDWATPESLYTQTKQAAPYSARVRSNLGNELVKAGQMEQAFTEIKTAERMDPHDVRVKANLANAYIASGDLNQARQKLAECLALDPRNTSALLHLADILNQQHDTAGANTCYIRAAATTLDVRPRVLHALFLLEHRRLVHASAIGRECYALEPGNAIVHNVLGAVATEAGNFPAARSAFERARHLDRHSADADFNLGNLATRQQDLEEAEASYRRALAREPGHPQARYQLGLLLWRRGDFAAAEIELEAALRLAPGSPAIEQALDRVRRHDPAP